MIEYNHSQYGYIWIANHAEMEDILKFANPTFDTVEKLVNDSYLVATWTVIGKGFDYLYQGLLSECYTFVTENRDIADSILLIGIEDLINPNVEEVMCYEQKGVTTND